MKVRIRVNKGDIKVGECGESSKCALALATNRVLKGVYHSSIEIPFFDDSSPEIKIRYQNSKKVLHVVKLPARASEFIDDFDTYGGYDGGVGMVDTTSFNCDIPSKFLKRKT